MNIFIASVYSINSYSRGIMPDVLQKQIDENPDANIYYLTNSHSFNLCYFNINKEPDVCYRCKTGVNDTIKLIRGSFNHLKISDLVTAEDDAMAKAHFSGVETVQFDQVFENFEVGAATLSTYFSRTRDRNLLHVNQPFVKELAVNALALYLAIKRFLKEKDIDKVYNFNGRQDYVRAIMRASLNNKIDCYNVERTRIGGFIDFYKNVLPHNIQAKKTLVESCWEQSVLPENQKMEIASQFFKRQRAGESVIFSSYLPNQTKDNLPKGIFNGNKNVVLYNSSDDEFAALGEEFQNPLFEHQNGGIIYLVKLFGERLQQYNLIIRMHPNLTGVNFDYVQEIKDLHQKYSNIFVVFPESEVHSYALLDIAEKVFSFGSTLGLEANVNGIPVILLGKCFYYYSNVAYVPKQKEDIIDLVTQPLKPLPVINALKFGFYYLNGGIKTKYYFEEAIGQGVFFKGKRIHTYNFWQRVKSKFIQQAYRILGIRLSF